MNNNSTLLMVGILAAVVAILSAGLSLIPVQPASALLEDGDGGDTSFSFEQDQSNECSFVAGCSNTATITFGFLDM